MEQNAANGTTRPERWCGTMTTSGEHSSVEAADSRRADDEEESGGTRKRGRLTHKRDINRLMASKSLSLRAHDDEFDELARGPLKS
jgi:hypothetical protein